jgi:hypothetical protein
MLHDVVDAQVVTRAFPATKIVDPGPGLDGIKLLPDTASVKPPDVPAYALDGDKFDMFGWLEIVTVAVADRVLSAMLVATTSIRSGEGAD